MLIEHAQCNNVPIPEIKRECLKCNQLNLVRNDTSHLHSSMNLVRNDTSHLHSSMNLVRNNTSHLHSSILLAYPVLAVLNTITTLSQVTVY
jgi:hypothetical protein